MNVMYVDTDSMYNEKVKLIYVYYDKRKIDNMMNEYICIKLLSKDEVKQELNKKY